MQRPIKILFIYHTSMIGGGSYCLLNILREIDRDRFNPVVVLASYGPLVEEIRKLGIEVYVIKKMHVVPYNVSTFTPKRLRHAAEIIASFIPFRNLLLQVAPDIVYVNTMMMYPYLRVAKKMGIKTVVHVREHWPEGEHKWQRKIALDHIKKYADRIIAINTYSMSMLEDAKQPKTIVYDWIDLSQRNKPMPLEDVFEESLKDKKVYLYMGGMQVIKGPMEVIDVFTHDITDPKARLLVLGIKTNDMTGGIKGFIKNLLAKIGYTTYSKQVMDMIASDNRIKCIPSTYDVKNIYEQVYCILSYFKIPHANLALAESIITGTVNVAARTPESEEYSHQGELAQLFEINNEAAFLCAVKDVEDNYDMMKEKLSRDSHYVAEMFDKKTNVERLMDFIDF